MNSFLHDWGLAVITFVPLAGAAVMLAIPKESEQVHKLVALVSSLLTAAVGVWLLAEFDYGKAGSLQFGIDRKWIELIHSRFTMGTVPYGNLVGKAVRLFWNSNGSDYAARQVVNGSGE